MNKYCYKFKILRANGLIITDCHSDEESLSKIIHDIENNKNCPGQKVINFVHMKKNATSIMMSLKKPKTDNKMSIAITSVKHAYNIFMYAVNIIFAFGKMAEVLYKDIESNPEKWKIYRDKFIFIIKRSIGNLKNLKNEMFEKGDFQNISDELYKINLDSNHKMNSLEDKIDSSRLELYKIAEQK